MDKKFEIFLFLPLLNDVMFSNKKQAQQGDNMRKDRLDSCLNGLERAHAERKMDAIKGTMLSLLCAIVFITVVTAISTMDILSSIIYLPWKFVKKTTAFFSTMWRLRRTLKKLDEQYDEISVEQKKLRILLQELSDIMASPPTIKCGYCGSKCDYV